MSFEQERLAQEKHDRVQRILHTRFSQFSGQPTPKEIIDLVNASIGEVDKNDGELVYEPCEDAP